MRVPLDQISNESINKFFKSLDIGNVNQISGVPGVITTLTGLAFLILDRHYHIYSVNLYGLMIILTILFFSFQMMVHQRHLSYQYILAVSICGTWKRESEAGRTNTCHTVSVCQKSISWSFFGSSTQKRWSYLSLVCLMCVAKNALRSLSLQLICAGLVMN